MSAHSVLPKQFTTAVSSQQVSVKLRSLNFSSSLQTLRQDVRKQLNQTGCFDTPQCSGYSRYLRATTTVPAYSACAIAVLKRRLKLANSNASVVQATPDNLTTAERVELLKLEKLSKTHKLIVRKADKSKQLVLMNTEDYDAQMQQLLADQTSFQPLAYNLQKYTAAKIISTVKQFRKASVLTQQDVDLLLQNTKEPKVRKLYCLPKTHKPADQWPTVAQTGRKLPPLRPICPDINTETACSAKLISNYLQPVFQNIPSYIANSYAVKEKLMQLRDLPDTAVLVVADVKDLYPSIPILDALDRVIQSLDPLNKLIAAGNPTITRSDLHVKHKELIVKLLQIQLENNVVEFRGNFYKQLRGVPMGKAWAPAVASIYLHFWEDNILQNTNVVPLFYFRYIDDIFFLVNNVTEAKTLIDAMQNADCNIKLSSFTIGKEVNFLDLKITLNDGLVHTEMYRKPSDLRVLLHAHSAHSAAVKRNVMCSELIRIYRLSSNLKTAGKQMREFMYLMRTVQQFKHQQIRLTWLKFKQWLLTTCGRQQQQQQLLMRSSGTCSSSRRRQVMPTISEERDAEVEGGEAVVLDDAAVLHHSQIRNTSESIALPNRDKTELSACQNREVVHAKVDFSKQLFLANNTFQNRFRVILGSFLESLPERERASIGDIKIRQFNTKCLGRSLFKP